VCGICCKIYIASISQKGEKGKSSFGKKREIVRKRLYPKTFHRIWYKTNKSHKKYNKRKYMPAKWKKLGHGEVKKQKFVQSAHM
jgi:hypothetical protein